MIKYFGIFERSHSTKMSEYRSSLLLAFRGRARARFLLFAFALIIFATLQYSVTGDWARVVPLQFHSFTLLAVNLALIVCGLLFLASIFNSFWTAAFVVGTATCFIALANHIKISMLGLAVEPSADVHRLGDVAPFLGGFLASRASVLCLLGLCLFGFLVFLLAHRIPLRRWQARQRLQIGVSTLAVLAAVPAMAPFLHYLHLYEQSTTDWVACCAHDGVALAYLANLSRMSQRAASSSRPPDYDRQRIQSICERILKSYQPTVPVGDHPDIVVIAAEAMMDPSALPGISHPVDWLSSIHNLQKQSGPYRLISPSLGGMSINADFEVLTGFSTRFIGSQDDCVSDHLERAVPSVARLLKSAGYETVAIVPTSRTLFRHSWMFTHAFGFDRALFQDDMGVQMGDTPDSEMAKLVVQELNRPSARPRFIYVQFEKNHSPWDEKKHYADPNVVPSSHLTGTDASSFNTYIQGVYETDRVVGNLARFLDLRHKPAVLALYGDHLPALGASTLENIGVFSGSDNDSARRALAAHTTPGLIWSTGGPSAQPHDGVTGMNYFIPYVLKTAGISHPFYTGFLMDMHATLPAMNAHVICRRDSQPVASVPPESLPTLNDYELLQYDMLYGQQYAAGLFPELKKD